MVSIALGVYIFFYVLNVFSIMRYIQGTLTLKQISVGQTLGIYMLSLIAGLLIGIYLTVSSGVLNGVQVLLMGITYIGFMLSILIQLKGFVEQCSRKKLGLKEYNRATSMDGLYNGTNIMVLVGSIIMVLGVMYSQSSIFILGLALVVVLYNVLLQQSKRVVLYAPYLTLEEREAKITQFNEAVEENRLDELDNADKTMYKKSRRKLNKYIKKRG